jgi:hypothetical protein
LVARLTFSWHAQSWAVEDPLNRNASAIGTLALGAMLPCSPEPGSLDSGPVDGESDVEKVIVALAAHGGADSADADWVDRLRGPVVDALLDLNPPGLTLNVRDAAVRDSVMTMTTLDPPVRAFISIWTQQHYGEQMRAALELITAEAEQVAAYLVTESVPLPPPASLPGQRTPGLANVALLRRPADLDEPTWRERWHRDHTPVAIATQATFGYVQNYVVQSDVRLRAELCSAPADPGCARGRGHRRGVVPHRGGRQSARVLRRYRRSGPAGPDDAHGRQRVGVRRQRRYRYGAHQPFSVPRSVP